MSNDTLHKNLKEITKELHNEVEELILPKKLFLGKISKSEYLEYLRILYKLHFTIERELLKYNDWNQYNFEIINYLRKDLIIKDIEILSDNEVFDNPLCDSSEEIKIKTFGEAIGYLYVVTGSTMGGQILSKKVVDSFPNSSYQDANNYFSAFKEKTIPMWMEFLQFLNTYASTVNDENENNNIIQGSKNCFVLFKENLR